MHCAIMNHAVLRKISTITKIFLPGAVSDDLPQIHSGTLIHIHLYSASKPTQTYLTCLCLLIIVFSLKLTHTYCGVKPQLTPIHPCTSAMFSLNSFIHTHLQW